MLYKVKFACYNIVQTEHNLSCFIDRHAKEIQGRTLRIYSVFIFVYLNISITCRIHYHLSFVWLQIHQVMIHTPHRLSPLQ